MKHTCPPTGCRFTLLLVASLVLSTCACGPSTDQRDENRIGLAIWAHAGQEAERQVLEEQVARFNASQDSLRVNLTFLPEGSYNSQVQAAALAGDLPDLLEIDGPFVSSYAWQGHLRPLDDLLPQSHQLELLPTLLSQGQYRNRLYAVGIFDSGLGLYARRSLLSASGVRLPGDPAAAWNVQEFDGILRELAKTDADGAVLDLKLNYAGEWYTYAFSPLIQSAGGDLLDRDRLIATGILNGPAAVAALSRIQSWITAGLVDPNLDDAAFSTGRVALALGGHWNYADYSQAWGEDLVLLPLPDFGQGSRTGMGSWCWTLSRSASHPEAASAFLQYLLSPESVLEMTAANGAVPGSRTATERSALYGEEGPLRLLAAQLLGEYAVPRPRTPAYPIITEAFQEAFDKIRSGEDVQRSLDEAAAVIDCEIEDNDQYSLTGTSQ